MHSRVYLRFPGYTAPRRHQADGTVHGEMYRDVASTDGQSLLKVSSEESLLGDQNLRKERKQLKEQRIVDITVRKLKDYRMLRPLFAPRKVVERLYPVE